MNLEFDQIKKEKSGSYKPRFIFEDHNEFIRGGPAIENPDLNAIQDVKEDPDFNASQDIKEDPDFDASCDIIDVKKDPDLSANQEYIEERYLDLYASQDVTVLKKKTNLIIEDFVLDESTDIKVEQNEPKLIEHSDTLKANLNFANENQQTILKMFTPNKAISMNCTITNSEAVDTQFIQNDADNLLVSPIVNDVTKKDILTKHQSRINVKIREHKCDFCNEKFATKVEKDMHSKIHETQNVPCRCEHKFINIHHPNCQKLGTFVCTFCKHLFSTQDSLNKHIISIHCKKSSTFNCNPCQLAFSDMNHLRSHRNTHAHKSRNKSHSVLTDSFDYKMAYTPRARKHIFHRWTEETHTHKCSVCGIVYYSKRSLAAHMKKHTKEAEVQYPTNHFCQFCKFQTSNESCLEKHMKNSHKLKRPYFCKLCVCKYSTLSELVEHIREHFSEDGKSD